jgi:peptidoglycan/LPS O-acetylase OafA/YrhL
VAFSLVIYFLPYGHHLYIDRIAKFFIFFVVGGVIRQNEVAYYKALDLKYLLWVLLPIFISLLYFVPLKPYLQSPSGILIVGLMGIPILHGISRHMMLADNFLTNKLFLMLGRYSYVIYLFNVIVIGVVKGVMFKFTTWDGGNFWYFIPILIVSGLFLPIISESLVLRHIPFIRDRILAKPALKKSS